MMKPMTYEYNKINPIPVLALLMVFIEKVKFMLCGFWCNFGNIFERFLSDIIRTDTLLSYKQRFEFRL